MPRQSAGLLMYCQRNGVLEVLLVHPGGPFWAKKDAGAWSIPKGEFSGDENALMAARREFEEETGFLPAGRFVPLTSIKQPSGKVIYAWALEGIWMRQPSGAIHSPWSGLPNPAFTRNSLK